MSAQWLVVPRRQRATLEGARRDIANGDRAMETFQTLAVVLIGGTAGWVYLRLKERIDFLEHEVRWLRSEVEAMKPTEVKSKYDRG